MTDQQKRAVAVVAFIALAAVTTLTITFAAAGAVGALKGNQPLGSIFLSLAKGFSDLHVMLKGLGVLVLAGAGFLGAQCTKSAETIAGAIFLTAGIAAAVVLHLLLYDDNLAAEIWQPRTPAMFDDHDAFLGAARPLVMWTGGALVAGLAAFLGFSNAKRQSDA